MSRRKGRITLWDMLRRWRIRSSAAGRRAIALLALCGFVASFVGVPMPIAAPAKDATRAAASTGRLCCCQSASKGVSQCCGHCGCGRSKSAAVATHEAPQVELVLSILARKCQGHAEIWLALGAIALPPERLAVTVDAPCCGQLVTNSIALDSLRSRPATPPPRV